MTGLQFLVFSLFFVNSVALFEGDACILLNSDVSSGKCIDIHKCEYAKHLLRLQKIPPQCGFKGKIPLVCCATNHQMEQKRRSEEKCEEYHNLRNQLTIIAHGQKALPKEFRHMAAIGFDNKNQTMWLCGGSLISERFVITAGHCIVSRQLNEPPKWVRLGDLDLDDTNDDASPEDVRIQKTFIHPDYRPPSHYNDIALVKLSKEVKFGLYIKPACLHTKKEVPNKLEAIGWGKIDFFSDSISSHLMKVTLNSLSYSNCARRYANMSLRNLRNGIRDQTQLCAGDEIGRDTCPGDSGGPLHFKNEGVAKIASHYVVVGITSFGKACGLENSAGVYTRVSAYVSWIESIVWPL